MWIAHSQSPPLLHFHHRYMFDVIYVTWFVHLGVALISDKFWWFYLAVSEGLEGEMHVSYPPERELT